MNIIGIAEVKTFKPIGEPNCYDVVLHTNELNRDAVGNLHELKNKCVKYFITDEEITQEMKGEVSKMPIVAESKRSKMTLSQQLRWEIKLLWEREGEIGIDSEFYESKMNQIIEHIKSK